MSGHQRNISLTPPESPEGALSTSSSSHSRRSPSSFSAGSSASSVPSAPHPSDDPNADVCPTVHFASQSALPSEDKEGCNVFKMAPTVALTLLARSIELIVSLTPEEQASPPAAPLRPSAAFPNINSNPSWVNPFPGHRSPSVSPPSAGMDSVSSGFAFNTSDAGDIDGVTTKKKSPASPHSSSMTSPAPAPLSSPQDPFPGKVIGEGVEAMDNMTQYSTITRKFWSKTAPPISVEDYLFRIHRYCPLSTAVYLAASLYIHRLSLLDRVLPITPLSVHRVLIAALRVAAKALEDCQHSQSLFAKVGGLTETELSKLEVSFCFLISFDLKVDEEMLEQQAWVLKQQAEKQIMIGTMGLMKGRRSTIKEEEISMVRERSRSRSRALSPRPRKIMIDV